MCDSTRALCRSKHADVCGMDDAMLAGKTMKGLKTLVIAWGPRGWSEIHALAGSPSRGRFPQAHNHKPGGCHACR